MKSLMQQLGQATFPECNIQILLTTETHTKSFLFLQLYSLPIHSYVFHSQSWRLQAAECIVFLIN